ncbi:hypothetical protein H6503_00650 [Candidatus Woesearchaeota archaeon]|nr:hypothetical protein [Candidatus Woesearchaeota archaeon]
MDDPNIIRKFSKSSQISVFMTIIMIIVLLIIIIFTLNSISSGSTTLDDISDIDTNNVKIFFDECMQAEINGISDIITSSGRYIGNPDNAFNFNNTTVQYFLDGEVVDIPTIEDIQREIEFFAYETMNYCLNEYTFEDLRINFSESKVFISLEESNSLIVEADFSISEGDKSKNDKAVFSYEIPYRIREIISAASEITEYDKRNQYTYSIIEINEIAYRNRFNLEIINNGNGTMIYHLYDGETEMYFATTCKNYDCKDIPVDDSSVFDGLIRWCVQ